MILDCSFEEQNNLVGEGGWAFFVLVCVLVVTGCIMFVPQRSLLSCLHIVVCCLLFLCYLGKPGLVTGVSKSMVTARTAVVTWTNYSPGENEAPTTSITLRYQNSTSPYHLAIQPGSSSWKELINLKPFSKYNVTVMVSSVLGNGLWSNAVIFETLTASKFYSLFSTQP